MDDKSENRDRQDASAPEKTGLEPIGAQKVGQEQVNAFLLDEPTAPAGGAAPLCADTKVTAATAATPASAADSEAAAEAVAEPKPPPPSVAQGGTVVPGSALSAEQLEDLTAAIIAAMKTVYDPEIPTDIYELGLIYKIDISDDRDVTVDMTLTAPGCPVAGEMPVWVENAVSSVPGVGDVFVNLTFDPPWETSMMSEEARVALNMF